MKKLSFLFFIMALLVSCNNNDVENPKSERISFSNVLVQDVVNAPANTIDNLTAFDVWGHIDGGATVFEGTEVTKQGNGWVCAEEKIWQPKEIYHFHAFAPSGLIDDIGEYPNTSRDRGLSDLYYTNTAGDKDLIYAYATRTQGGLGNIDDDGVMLSFSHLLSRVKLTVKNNLTSVGNVTISDIQLIDGVKSATLNTADSNIANWAWTETSTGTFDFGDTEMISKGESKEAENVLYMIPVMGRDYNLTFKFVFNSDSIVVKSAVLSDVNFAMGASYNVIVTIEDKDITTQNFTVKFMVVEVKEWGDYKDLDATLEEEDGIQETLGMENGHEWVDLGLSVKWATCNVGATKPEDYGDYFAWGEVASKETYNWETYKYCVDDYNNLTKYCNERDYGKNYFTDNKIVLDPEDDAATINWGGIWRIPTKEEQDELRNNCTWNWITQNGVKGYKVTGSNGNSIFLPAAGEVYEGTFDYAGTYGHYWSSSLYVDIAYDAYYISFSSGGRVWNRESRYFGYPVRPVCQ